MATLSDVAVRAGVSLATASRVLNGSAHRVVGPELRQRVTAAAAELGYVPNKAAQAMARGHTDVVSLVVGSIADPYFSSIVAGVSRETQSHDLRVTISESDGSEKSTLAVIANASSQQARALIFAGGAITSTPAVTRAISDFTTHTGSPVLAIGATNLPPEIKGIGVDDRAAVTPLHLPSVRQPPPGPPHACTSSLLLLPWPLPNLGASREEPRGSTGVTCVGVDP